MLEKDLTTREADQWETPIAMVQLTTVNNHSEIRQITTTIHHALSSPKDIVAVRDKNSKRRKQKHAAFCLTDRARP